MIFFPFFSSLLEMKCVIFVYKNGKAGKRLVQKGVLCVCVQVFFLPGEKCRGSSGGGGGERCGGGGLNFFWTKKVFLDCFLVGEEGQLE